MYRENPKTKGSGIICAIPQEGLCPVKCAECFFQGGRSYLEPLKDNLPNMPSLEQVGDKVVRVNDGNDSNNRAGFVRFETKHYKRRFFNTSIAVDLEMFKDPVVLTVNPHVMTNKSFYDLEEIPENLMFVRARVNTWNLKIIDQIVEYYTENEIPVVLTFMAYFKSDKFEVKSTTDYMFRKRTLNSYWAITTKAWRTIMKRYENNNLVYSCGRAGDFGGTADLEPL